MIGNCQAVGVAQCLRLLLPDARVETLLVTDLVRRFGTMARLVRHLAACDHVVSHDFPPVLFGGARAMAEALPRVRLFPTITFAGFHPDIVFLGDVAALRLSRLVPAPLGSSHSAIALAGFLEGLSVSRTLDLYEDAAFERLGYYALWQGASDHLRASAAALGFPLERELAAWTRRGCFMHDHIHPRLHVLGDLAARLAREAGLQPLDVRVEDYLVDGLIAGAVWPVYPALAERYGVPAGGLFRARLRPNEPPRCLDLPGFVAQSHARYARLDPVSLACPRVEAWRADPATRAVFARAA